MHSQLNKLFNNLNSQKYDKYLELIPDFKKEKTQKFTTVVLTLIAIIMLAVFAINPTLSTIANLQKQLDDAKFVYERLNKKISNLSTLQTQYNNLQDDLSVIYEAIPQGSNVPKLAGQVQAIAQNSNVTLVNFQATDITEKKKFSFYTFSISARGSYSDILKFLDNLINMQRIIYIQNINMNQAEETQGQVQINIRGEAFFKD